MFGHPSQHQHMLAGIKKAAASPKTPAHLKAHLEKRMNSNLTGSRSQMKPKTPMKTTPDTSALAEKQIAAPPQPFANPKGVLQKAPAKMAKTTVKKSKFFGGR